LELGYLRTRSFANVLQTHCFIIVLNSNENPYFADMGYEYPIYQSSYPILCTPILWDMKIPTVPTLKKNHEKDPPQATERVLGGLPKQNGLMSPDETWEISGAWTMNR